VESHWVVSGEVSLDARWPGKPEALGLAVGAGRVGAGETCFKPNAHVEQAGLKGLLSIAGGT
jgi:hypothetical protein